MLYRLHISSQHIILCYELIEGHGTKTAHNTSRLVQVCWRKTPHNTAGGSIREPDRHAEAREAGVHRTIDKDVPTKKRAPAEYNHAENTAKDVQTAVCLYKYQMIQINAWLLILNE